MDYSEESNNKYLITGGSSPIGNEIFKIHATRKDNVAVTMRKKVTEDESFFEFDLQNKSQIAELIKKAKPHRLYHCAHIPPTALGGDSKLYFKVNLELTKQLVAEALESGCQKLVFTSSAAVYGDKGSKPFAENSERNPKNEYAELKSLQEDQLIALSKNTGLQLQILRIFNVYGPNCHNSIINKILSDTVHEKTQILGGKSFVRDYIHLHDVAEIAFSVMQNSTENVQILNAGSGVATNSDDLAKYYELIHHFSPEIVTGFSSFSLSNNQKLLKRYGISPRPLSVDSISKLMKTV